MSYTEAFTHKRFYTQMLLHTHTLSHTEAITQRLLHTDAFTTHRSFCTQTLLHTDTFTHRHFYPQKLLHTHTCSETSLRILLWNASLVHKTIHKKLTGKKWMTRRERQWRRILSKSLLEATVPSDEVSSNSDCENRTVMTHNWCLKFDMPVLGLAGCHSEKWKLMQVRRADQALYHHELTVSSLGSVCQSCTAVW